MPNSRRQIPQYALKAPPPELKAHLSQETFDKAQAYGLAKARFQLLKLVGEQSISWAMVKFDFYAETWKWTTAVMNRVGLGGDRSVSVVLALSAESGRFSIPSFGSLS